jgi:tripartite-type tricarboxylate transporter receptor subunit TctC
MTRRALVALACVALATPAAAFPDRPLTLIYPYPPGSDVAARPLAEAMAADLGQHIVVVNRDGASGVVGMRALAVSVPDGHTIGYAPITPIAVQPHMLRNSGLGPDALAPVCNVTDNVIGIVVPATSPIADLPSLAAAARSGQLSFGSPGPNSVPFLAVERLRAAAGGEYLHVPFRGGGASLTELLGGRLDFTAAVVATAGGLLRRGELRLLAVFSERRHPAFPDVPTVAEAGFPGALQPSFASLYAPRGTPASVLDRLELACRRAVESEAFRRAAAAGGVVVDWMGRAELQQRIEAQHAAFGRLLRNLGVEPE